MKTTKMMTWVSEDSMHTQCPCATLAISSFSLDEGDGDSRRRGSASSTRSTSPSTYLRNVQQRRARILASSSNLDASSYSIEAVGAAPHGSHVYTMALSADGTTLLSGGNDGHVRKYDVYASMNGRSMLTQNVRHQFVDGVLRAGVLSAW